MAWILQVLYFSQDHRWGCSFSVVFLSAGTSLMASFTSVNSGTNLPLDFQVPKSLPNLFYTINILYFPLALLECPVQFLCYYLITVYVVERRDKYTWLLCHILWQSWIFVVFSIIWSLSFFSFFAATHYLYNLCVFLICITFCNPVSLYS